MVETSGVKEYFRKYFPWVAVLTGSYGLFAYSLLSNFPLLVQQLLGFEIIYFCSRDAVLRLIMAMFWGRVIVLVLREPLFSVARIIFLQVPLWISVSLGRTAKRRLFKGLAKCRYYMDLVYAGFVSRAVELSIFFGGLLYAYIVSGSWRAVLGFAFFIGIVGLSADTVKNNRDKRLRVRYRFKWVFDDLSGLRNFAYSTAILVLSFLVGVSEGKHFIDSGVQVETSSGVYNVMYMSEKFFLTLESNESDGMNWSIVSNRGDDVNIVLPSRETQ